MGGASSQLDKRLAAQTINRCSLGRKAFIGQLYDVRTETFLDKHILSQEALSQFVTSQDTFKEKPQVHVSYAHELADKLTALGVESDLHLPIVLGGIPLTGHWRYLAEDSTSQDRVTGALHCKFSSTSYKLAEGFEKVVDLDSINSEQATHFVCQVEKSVFSTLELNVTRENEDILKEVLEYFKCHLTGGTAVGKHQDIVKLIISAEGALYLEDVNKIDAAKEVLKEVLEKWKNRLTEGNSSTEAADVQTKDKIERRDFLGKALHPEDVTTVDKAKVALRQVLDYFIGYLIKGSSSSKAAQDIVELRLFADESFHLEQVKTVSEAISVFSKLREEVLKHSRTGESTLYRLLPLSAFNDVLGLPCSHALYSPVPLSHSYITSVVLYMEAILETQHKFNTIVKFLQENHIYVGRKKLSQLVKKNKRFDTRVTKFKNIILNFSRQGLNTRNLVKLTEKSKSDLAVFEIEKLLGKLHKRLLAKSAFIEIIKNTGASYLSCEEKISFSKAEEALVLVIPKHQDPKEEEYKNNLDLFLMAQDKIARRLVVDLDVVVESDFPAEYTNKARLVFWNGSQVTSYDYLHYVKINQNVNSWKLPQFLGNFFK